MERISGLTKILAASLIFEAVFNFIKIISYNEPYIKLITYCIVFIVPGIIYLLISLKINIKNQRKIAAWLILLYGVAYSLQPGMGNFSGATFFLFSIHADYSRNKTFIKGLILFLCLGVKSTIINPVSMQVVNLIYINLMIIGLSFTIFKSENKTKENKINSSDKDNQVIKYIIDGLTPKEIDDKICVELGTVRKRISRLRKKNNCATDLLLGIKIGQHINKIDKQQLS